VNREASQAIVARESVQPGYAAKQSLLVKTILTIIEAIYKKVN
jgi:hypothetical protein